MITIAALKINPRLFSKTPIENNVKSDDHELQFDCDVVLYYGFSNGAFARQHLRTW